MSVFTAKTLKPFCFFSKESKKMNLIGNSNQKEINDLIRVNEELKTSIKNSEITCQELVNKSDYKTKFLSSIAHELRNYLNPMTTINSLIKSETYGKVDPEYIELASEASHIIREMMALTYDLIDLNQSESGQFSINMSEEIDIVLVIKRAIKINFGLSLKRKNKIEFDETTSIPKIKLDERRMKQILVNLISNALKYSCENKTIIISAREEIIFGKKQLIISVKDEGIGMSKDDIKMALNGLGTKIAKNNLDNKDFDSHGIGFLLVKQLVELQKGKMEIISEINQGTEIKLIFPYLM